MYYAVMQALMMAWRWRATSAPDLTRFGSQLHDRGVDVSEAMMHLKETLAEVWREPVFCARGKVA